LFNFEPNKCCNRLRTYNWQQKDWPKFTFHTHGIEEEFLAIAVGIGHVSGVLAALPENIQLNTL